MLYDGETGYLLLAAYTEGAQAQLYAIDPERSLGIAPLGGFGDGAWPVVSLYRYHPGDGADGEAEAHPYVHI